ncbi:Putative Chromate ion transporter (Eurofung) [Aspergillus calidoustus]|uniref:Putative Chromate ion transporter (Eurofung) n=1 Tax=Aspergillus calidoustus TaxID=454130 RepID=A0A0U5GPR2_ASPCI|nr:Putative Chromate ion transporter (Eurofung) [Aspergillus calidoustus]
MLFCLALLHAGFIPALLAFFFWSLPGAIGMYALSLGVQRIDEKLPAPVYALLSGLNASTVGIIALAAVQLAEKAIRDKISRILVIFGACAGLCYSALWYFPILMVSGGVATVLWDGLVYQQILRAKRPCDSYSCWDYDCCFLLCVLYRHTCLQSQSFTTPFGP